MKNTLIVIAEDLIRNYRSNVLERLYADMDFCSLAEFASDITQLGKDMNAMLNPVVAFDTFRNEFKFGSAMMLLNSNDFEQVEAWDNNKEQYRIAIFREDGTAVGIVSNENINY